MIFFMRSEVKIQNPRSFDFELWMAISSVFCMRFLKFFFVLPDMILGYPDSLSSGWWCIENRGLVTSELDGGRHRLAVVPLGATGQIEMSILNTPLYVFLWSRGHIELCIMKHRTCGIRIWFWFYRLFKEQHIMNWFMWISTHYYTDVISDSYRFNQE